jgi:hypothetical protein
MMECRAVISPRKLRANRENARSSTGPRTPEGKAQSSRNARRHGLNVSVVCDHALAADVESLAHDIAGPGATAEVLELARDVAEAQIDLSRVRRARHQALLRLFSAGNYSPADGSTAQLAQVGTLLAPELTVFERYEGRALSRRRSAVRAFDAARVTSYWKQTS